MRLTLRNVKIDRCGTGIKSRGPLVLDAEGLDITNTKRAMDLEETKEVENSDDGLNVDGNRRKRWDDITNGVIVALVSATALAGIGALWKLVA